MLRTCVLLRESRTHSLRVLQKFVRTVHHALLLQYIRVSYSPEKRAIEPFLTSFEDNALLVKSLQHDVKHRSTRLEYIRMKSCI